MNSKRKLSLKTLSLTAIMSAVVILSGCSTPQIVENKKAFPDDMYVVSLNADQALTRIEKKAHNNIELLNDLKNQKTITVEPVKHVQNLDTRSQNDIKLVAGPHSNGKIVNQNNNNISINNKEEETQILDKNKSNTDYIVIKEKDKDNNLVDKKISVKYSFIKPVIELDDNGKPKQLSDESKVSVANKKINLIEWQNASLNELIYKLSKHIGYEFEVVQLGNYNDMPVKIKEENVSPLEILNSLGQKYSKTEYRFDLFVSHPAQKIVVIYK